MQNFVLTVIDGLRGDIPNFDKLEQIVSDEVSIDRDLDTLEEIFNGGTSIPSWRSNHLQPEPSVASLLTGLYPREHGIFGTGENLRPGVETLMDCLSDNNFHSILMNGHETYYRNGIASRFTETIMGPPQRLFTKIKTINEQDKSVFVLYEPLELREPYLLSKFPPDEDYHKLALREASKISSTFNLGQNFEREDVHLMTSDWEVPHAGSDQLPVWEVLINFVHKHHRPDTISLKNTIDHLVRYYLYTVELISKYHLKRIQKFTEEDDVGKKTSFFLTSNSSHGLTERNSQKTFGLRKKPTEDALNVPALFLNLEDDSFGEHQLTSHIDFMPTILDAFDLDYSEDISGQSLYEKDFDRQKLYAEASRTFKTSSRNESNKAEDSEKKSVISWSCLIDQDGWKLYRRGMPITEKDLQLPVKDFIWTIMAKIALTSLSEGELSERTERFNSDDSYEARKQLAHQLQENSDPDYELYNWKKDYLEDDNLLMDDSPELEEKIKGLIQQLEERFEDPYKDPVEVVPTETEPKEIDLLAPMKAVGYVE